MKKISCRLEETIGHIGAHAEIARCYNAYFEWDSEQTKKHIREKLWKYE